MQRYLALALLSSSLFALPRGGIPESGGADLRFSPQTLEILAPDRSIINWADFSIEEGETVRFLQPSAEASVLNRVLEAFPSRILGSLEANGQVLLINPNGILVGKDSIIDTGSLIASTLDIANSVYLAKEELIFEGTSQSTVQHLGSIKTRNGNALLLGWNVDTQGVLEAIDGAAGAIAANHVRVQDRIWVKGRALDADNSYSAAFKLDAKGSISSKTSAETGGEVLLMGDFIYGSQLTLDASGRTCGGSVFIGGGEKGQDPRFSNAAHIFLDSSVAIRADAQNSGTGGKVIVWSDNHTHFLGTISARGGAQSGDGGFAEVSGNILDFQGFANLSALKGSGGTLLLDPSDITVSTAVGTALVGSNSCAGGAAGCLGCGACFNPCSQNNAAITPITINNTTIVNTLNAGTNVILDATQGPAGGGGTITINAPIGNRIGSNATECPATGPCWTGTGNLILNAVNTISINANIQNNGPVGAAGSIYITSVNGPINISHLPPPFIQIVGVGSQNGTTQICAPNADLNMLSNNGFFTQLGFLTPGELGAVTCTGPILVNCRNLTMSGGIGAAVNGGAKIGHGAYQAVGVQGQDLLTTTAAATITVNATGNITMTNVPKPGTGVAALVFVQIGHGSRQLVDGSSLGGDLTVTAGGRIELACASNNAAAVNRNIVWIGHGAPVPAAATILGITINANHTVQAAGDICAYFTDTFASANPCTTACASSTPPCPACAGPCSSCGCTCLNTFMNGAAGESRVTIGGFDNFLRQITGNLTVTAGGSINLLGPVSNTALGASMFIGWYSRNNSAGVNTNLNGHIRVSACNDLSIHANDTDALSAISNFGTFRIGVSASDAANTSVLNIAGPSDVEVAVGRNLCFDAIAPNNFAAQNGTGFIGNLARTGVSNTYVAAAGNISISGVRTLGIRGTGDVNVAAGGNIALTTTGNNLAIIGPENANTAVTTRVYAGGNITATNSASNLAVIGRGVTAQAAYASSLDVRAGGNINLSAPFTLNAAGNAVLPTSGSINIQADANLGAGMLWQSAGNQMTSVCNAALASANPLSNACAANAIQSNSAAKNADLTGSLTFDFGTFAGTITRMILNTSTGAITLFSAAGQSLILDTNTGPNHAQIITTSGNITISGSTIGGAPADSFLNVTINNNGTAGQGLHTSGSIYVSANQNLTTTAGNSIQSTGAQPVTLIAGNSPNLTGILAITSNVLSSGGNILLQSGATNGCAAASNKSSINHTAGTVNPGAGNLTANANYDINLSSPAVPGMTTSTGFFHTTAGHTTTLTNTLITKTAAGLSGATDFLMISGRDMTMVNSQIMAPLSFVTLVVDNCYPAPPLIGPGAFNMDAASLIDPVNLRIFTALQNQNSIQGPLNGTAFVPGTLFIDTTTEVWCTYFATPFPYPLNTLGVPYTIFYKNCLGPAAAQATVIVTEFLLDLHPYNEFPGWMEEFFVNYQPPSPDRRSITSLSLLPQEPYYLRRRHLNIINHPKTWTTWFE